MIDLKGKLATSKPTISTSLEKVPRLTKPVLDVLNTQIANELGSSQLYRAFASYLDDIGWNNAAKIFFKYADDELAHMNKIYQYIYDRNCKAIVPPCSPVQSDFGGIKDIFTKGLDHEIMVTNQWENISCVAMDNKDKTTATFAQWFLMEQVEEENKMRDILDMLNLGMPDWALELEFKEMLG